MTHDENEILPDDDLSRISPLADGELPAAEAGALRARIASDAGLQRAQGRLERLTALSRAALAAPRVSPAEWQARADRVLRETSAEGRGEVRILTFRRTVLRYAVAAAFLLAATLALPLVSGPPGERSSDAGRLPIAHAPGANDFEVLEAWNGGSEYYLWLDYPEESSDAVVIMVNKT